MEDLSEWSLGQFEAMKIALEEAKSSGKGVTFQRNVEIRHRSCTDEKADLVNCSYEMRQPLDLLGNTFTDWKPVKRTFRKIFWTRSWVEAEAPSR
ncbi:hypothetical protein WG908_02395 [Sphingobium sp. AN641]|uniref:hypothetical protein n=1 Tax=Sphingobium sp. AN641 TaxID=3133443 RepID=UPI0030C1AC7E